MGAWAAEVGETTVVWETVDADATKLLKNPLGCDGALDVKELFPLLRPVGDPTLVDDGSGSMLFAGLEGDVWFNGCPACKGAFGRICPGGRG